MCIQFLKHIKIRGAQSSQHQIGPKRDGRNSLYPDQRSDARSHKDRAHEHRFGDTDQSALPNGRAASLRAFYACEVSNADFVEGRLHEAFGDHRVSKGREFFRLAPERARAALYIGALKEVKLGDEIFETKEVKAEVEAAKRRSRFRLSMVGIKPGTELYLA